MKDFLKDMAERALKTFCQTLVATIGTTTAFGEVDWTIVLSTSGLAALVSMLTSIGSYNFGDKGTASVVKSDK